MVTEIQPHSGGHGAAMEDQHIWQAAQEELRFQLTRPGYETWLRNAVLLECQEGRVFTIGVPTRLARDWLTERYVPLIRETLSELTSHDCEVTITVDPASAPALDEPAPLPDDAPVASLISDGLDAETQGSSVARLNPNFTFATFVVGNRSRFEWGLIADIQPPDFETRLAILNSKLGPSSRLVPDEVCSFIAHKIQKNIRELEGALIRVLAHASINGQPLTLDTAQRILRDIIPVADLQPVTNEA